MKKVLFLILAFLILGVNRVYAAQVVVLGPSNEVLAYKEFESSEGDTVLTALKKTGLSYKDEGDKYPQYKGSYITEIAGIGISKSDGWIFEVNYEWVLESASEHKINNSDKIIWCAYNNSERMNGYVFPESTLNKKDNKENNDLEVKNKQSVDDVINSLDLSDLDDKDNKEINNVEQPESKQSEDIRVKIDTNNKDYQKEVDYTDLGILGIIAVILAALGLIYFCKNDSK